MILLDASALLALLLDEPAAQTVAGMLRAGDAGVVSVNLTEVVDVAVRRWARSRAVVDSAIEPLLAAGLHVVTVDAVIALRAADVRIRRYSSRTPLSLADCLLLGAALQKAAAVVSTDRVLLDAATAEGLEVRRLAGRRPN